MIQRIGAFSIALNPRAWLTDILPDVLWTYWRCTRSSRRQVSSPRIVVTGVNHLRRIRSMPCRSVEVATVLGIAGSPSRRVGRPPVGTADLARVVEGLVDFLVWLSLGGGARGRPVVWHCRQAHLPEVET